MKKFPAVAIIIILLLLICKSNTAQVFDTTGNIIKPTTNVPHTLLPLRSSLHIGSLIYNKGFSTFVMPEITTPVAKKFTISAGTMIMKNFDNSISGNDHNIKDKSGSTSSLFYTKGTYLYNERISFSGMVFYEQHLFNSKFTKDNRGINLNGKGFAMDMNYKINSTSQFSIGVSTTNGYSPFGNGFFYQPMFYNSPFGW